MFEKSGEPTVGGIHEDAAPKNNPPRFTRTMVSKIPANLQPNETIIFDYEKISIDNNPNSKYYKSN